MVYLITMLFSIAKYHPHKMSNLNEQIVHYLSHWGAVFFTVTILLMTFFILCHKNTNKTVMLTQRGSVP